jgi:hypothetical protein
MCQPDVRVFPNVGPVVKDKGTGQAAGIDHNDNQGRRKNKQALVPKAGAGCKVL